MGGSTVDININAVDNASSTIKKIQKNIRDLQREGENLGETGARAGISSFFDSFSSGAAKIAKGIVVFEEITRAIENVAKAAYSAIKTVWDATSSYEQLAGGIDALFAGSEEAAAKVKKNAQNAWKTAQESQNTYLQNATSFAAKLKTNLDGNMDSVADYIQKSQVAMADNAATFGTTMEKVQETYESLSRGEGRLLDNLKLGYGGTKAELERMLTDFKESTGDLRDVSTEDFSMIIDAIQWAQEELNVAGRASLEAETTLEGSTSAMKAAWENLLTAFGDNEGIDEAMEDFEESFNTWADLMSEFMDTLSDAIGNADTSGIKTGVEKLAKSAANLIGTTLPIIAKEVGRIAPGVGAEIVSGFVSGLNAGIQSAITGEDSGIIDAINAYLNSILADVANAINEFAASIEEFVNGPEGLNLEGTPLELNLGRIGLTTDGVDNDKVKLHIYDSEEELKKYSGENTITLQQRVEMEGGVDTSPTQAAIDAAVAGMSEEERIEKGIEIDANGHVNLESVDSTEAELSREFGAPTAVEKDVDLSVTCNNIENFAKEQADQAVDEAGESTSKTKEVAVTVEGRIENFAKDQAEKAADETASPAQRWKKVNLKMTSEHIENFAKQQAEKAADEAATPESKTKKVDVNIDGNVTSGSIKSKISDIISGFTTSESVTKKVSVYVQASVSGGSSTGVVKEYRPRLEPENTWQSGSTGTENGDSDSNGLNVSGSGGNGTTKVAGLSNLLIIGKLINQTIAEGISRYKQIASDAIDDNVASIAERYETDFEGLQDKLKSIIDEFETEVTSEYNAMQDKIDAMERENDWYDIVEAQRDYNEKAALAIGADKGYESEEAKLKAYNELQMKYLKYDMEIMEAEMDRIDQAKEDADDYVDTWTNAYKDVYDEVEKLYEKLSTKDFALFGTEEVTKGKKTKTKVTLASEKSMDAEANKYTQFADEIQKMREKGYPDSLVSSIIDEYSGDIDNGIKIAQRFNAKDEESLTSWLTSYQNLQTVKASASWSLSNQSATLAEATQQLMQNIDTLASKVGESISTDLASEISSLKDGLTLKIDCEGSNAELGKLLMEIINEYKMTWGV